MQPYPPAFFTDLRAGAHRSAREVVPLVLGLLGPRRVVDVGCGLGTWLAVFKECGVGEVLGVDGAYVDRDLLEIPPDQFLAHDLGQPLYLGRTFDLAVSLEVAEHLPPACAAVLVESLVRLAPVVLFSAAIPFQVGVNHLNERWPEYWAELFEARDYHVVDCLRDKIWGNDRVEWWYAQNLLLYARGDYLLRHPLLRKEWGSTRRTQLALVHPRCLLQAAALNRQLVEKLNKR
jgi:SAM-dependent methyltransferase